MKKIIILCIAAAALFTQCAKVAEPVSVQDKQNGSFACKVNMKAAPSNVQSLNGYMFSLRDSSTGIIDTIRFGFLVSNGFATATVNSIPPGSWMTTINAYGYGDSLLYTGSSQVDVFPGQTSYATIRLGPAGQGTVEFYVYWDADTTNVDSLAPAIIFQSYEIVVRPGDSARFLINAIGADPLVYQWQRSLWGGYWDSIPGQNMNWLTIFPSVEDSAVEYRCVVSNPYGEAISNPTRVRVLDTIPPDTIPPDTSRQWLASTDTINANESWRQVRISFLPGDSITIRPYGEWTVDANHNGTYGPNGDTCHAAAGKAYVMPGVSKGALVGKIGRSGTPFLIGGYFSGVAADSGALYVVANERLGSNGSSLSDNSGFIQVNTDVIRY